MLLVSAAKMLVPVATAGLFDGIDPASAVYPPNGSPDLLNIRTGFGLWQTRLGISRWTTTDAQTFPAAGTLYYLAVFYRSATAARYRLGVINGQLYERLSTDPAFTAVGAAMATGVGVQNGVYNGATMKDRHYITDRVNSLKAYSHPAAGSAALNTVAQPTAPTVAPTVKHRTWKILEDWAGTVGNTPSDVTVSDATHFPCVVANPASDTVPEFSYWNPGGATAFQIGQFTVDNGGSKGDTVSRTSTSKIKPESHTIAFWAQQGNAKYNLGFEFGITGPGEFQTPLHPDSSLDDTPYMMFVEIGDLPSISYWRFKVHRVPSNVQTVYVGALVLPGYLQGEYQWFYTRYNPTTGAESKPSPISGDGAFEDFGAVGTPYKSVDPTVLQKAASILPTITNATDVDQIRIYRRGGVPPLTNDTRGAPVWVLVATIVNLTTTLAGGGTAAGAFSATLTAITTGSKTLAEGDWIVFEPGVASKEEFVRLALTRTYTDLVIDPSTLILTSASQPFGPLDVGKTISITGGTGFTVQTVTIAAVNATTGGATGAVWGAANSTGGQGTLTGFNTGTKTAFFESKLFFAHAAGVVVQAAHVDNASDESLDSSQRLEVERDDPPVGIHWIFKLPNGRLCAARWTAKPLGVALSNLPTPYHPYDQEVFPDGVDPITRGSPVQGFRVDLAGDSSGDSIVWGGLFREIPTFLTNRALYQLEALSQDQFSATAVVRRLAIGCIAGETVQEVDGALYWLAEGPRVVRWDGHGIPQDISFERCNIRLQNMGAADWTTAFARYHSTQDGSYYRLWFTPQNGNQCEQRLDFRLNGQAWEPCAVYFGNGNTYPWKTAVVWDGPGDSKELYAGHPTSGNVYQLETGSDDNGSPIKIRHKTARIPMMDVHRIDRCFFRLNAVADAVSMVITTGGSEYGDIATTYGGAGFAVSGSGDLEVPVFPLFTQKGRWVDFLVTGDVSHRPAMREIVFWHVPVRVGRMGA